MNHLETCPDCGQPFCPNCGEHHSGSVGAVPQPSTMRKPVRTLNWSDPVPPGTPITSPINHAPPANYLDYAISIFFRKAPENFYLGMDGIPSSVSTQAKVNYIIQKLQWWISHRWPTVNAWQAELGWSDEPGYLMWPMFVSWWYGFDSSYRGKHIVACAGKFWDPVTLQCM